MKSWRECQVAGSRFLRDFMDHLLSLLEFLRFWQRSSVNNANLAWTAEKTCNRALEHGAPASACWGCWWRQRMSVRNSKIRFICPQSATNNYRWFLYLSYSPISNKNLGSCCCFVHHIFIYLFVNEGPMSSSEQARIFLAFFYFESSKLLSWTVINKQNYAKIFCIVPCTLQILHISFAFLLLFFLYRATDFRKHSSSLLESRSSNAPCCFHDSSINIAKSLLRP